MTQSSVPTRVNADIASRAAAVAPGESRTTTEQINYWARIGMNVERAASVSGRQVLDAAIGHRQFRDLDPHDRLSAHAVVDSRISARVTTQSFGAAARQAGQVTVSIDEQGDLIEIAADGTRRKL